MANDVAVTEGSGPKKMKTREASSNIHFQGTDVAPYVPTSTGAPVNFSATGTATGKSGGGTFTFPAGTTHVLLSITTADVMFTEDGSTTPTSSVGTRLPAGSLVELGLAMNLNFIGVGGTAVIGASPRKYV